MSEPTELLTAEEQAQRLRIKTETLKAWARRGVVPRVVISPKVIRFDPVAVVAALTGKIQGVTK